jgi:hypothetical protein
MTSMIVAVSGGKDSTAMALRLAEVEPNSYEFCITPTGRELPEMGDHWARLEELLGSSLVRVPAPTLVELIVRYKALPNWRMRWCTRQIKIEPFMAYAASRAPAISYVGIRADEAQGRSGTDWSSVGGVTQDFPLVRWGWGLDRVKSYLAERGVPIPKRTDCDWCFFQRLIEWYELWRDHPALWREGEAVETLTGHTFRSAQRDSWPASMVDLRAAFESGKVPKDTRKQQRAAMCSWCAR